MSSINHTTYQTTPSFSALWTLTDDQSGPVNNATVRIGTYPEGSDVQDETTTSDNSIRSSITGGEGIPHYVTVSGANKAGVLATTSSRSLILDTSPPTLGEVLTVCTRGVVIMCELHVRRSCSSTFSSFSRNSLTFRHEQ